MLTLDSAYEAPGFRVVPEVRLALTLNETDLLVPHLAVVE